MATRKSEWLASIKPILDRDEAKKDAAALAKELGDILEVKVDASPENLSDLAKEFNAQLKTMGKQPIVFSEKTLSGIVSQFANAIADGISQGIVNGAQEGIKESLQQLKLQQADLKRERARIQAEINKKVTNKKDFNDLLDFNGEHVHSLEIDGDALEEAKKQYNEFLKIGRELNKIQKEQGVDSKEYVKALYDAEGALHSLYKMRKTLQKLETPIPTRLKAAYGLLDPYTEQPKYEQKMEEVGKNPTLPFYETNVGNFVGDSWERYVKSIKQSQKQLVDIDNQMSAIDAQIVDITKSIQASGDAVNVVVDNANNGLKTLNEIEEKYRELTEKLEFQNKQRLNAAINYKPHINKDGEIADGIKTFAGDYNEAVVSGDWTKEYSELVKFVRLYESYLEMGTKAQRNKITSKNNPYTQLYNQLKPMAENAENMLKSVVNMMDGKPPVGLDGAKKDTTQDTSVEAANAERIAEAKAKTEKEAREEAERQVQAEKEKEESLKRQRAEEERIAKAKERAAKAAAKKATSEEKTKTLILEQKQAILEMLGASNEAGLFFSSKTGDVSDIVEGGKHSVETTGGAWNKASTQYDTRLHSHNYDVAAPSFSGKENDFAVWLKGFDYIKKQMILANTELLSFDFSSISRETLRHIAALYSKAAREIDKEFDGYVKNGQVGEKFGTLDNWDEQFQARLREALNSIMEKPEYAGIMTSHQLPQDIIDTRREQLNKHQAKVVKKSKGADGMSLADEYERANDEVKELIKNLAILYKNMDPNIDPGDGFDPIADAEEKLENIAPELLAADMSQWDELGEKIIAEINTRQQNAEAIKEETAAQEKLNSVQNQCVDDDALFTAEQCANEAEERASQLEKKFAESFDGDKKQGSVNTEELKTLLNSIVYNVKIVHDDNDKTANKIAIDESALESTLKRVFAGMLEPSDNSVDMNKILDTLQHMPKSVKTKRDTDINPHYLTNPSGKVVTAYRGLHDSYGGLVSGRYHGGTFSTDDLELAKRYAGEMGKIEKVFLSMKNPLEIDGHGADWNRIEYIGHGADEASKKIIQLTKDIKTLEDYFLSHPSGEVVNPLTGQLVDDIENIREEILELRNLKEQMSQDPTNPYGVGTTNHFAELAKANGYDGVIFKNIKDGSEKAADVFVTFEREQMHYIETIGANATSMFERLQQQFGDYARYMSMTDDDVLSFVNNLQKMRDEFNALLNGGLLGFNKEELERVYGQLKDKYIDTNPAFKDYFDSHLAPKDLPDDYVQLPNVLNPSGHGSDLDVISEDFRGRIKLLNEELDDIHKTFGTTAVTLDEYKKELEAGESQGDVTSQTDSWALESTLQTVKGVLDNIQTNTSKIGTADASNVDTIAGTALDSRLTEIKSVLESINQKIVDGGKIFNRDGAKQAYKDSQQDTGSKQANQSNMFKSLQKDYENMGKLSAQFSATNNLETKAMLENLKQMIARKREELKLTMEQNTALRKKYSIAFDAEKRLLDAAKAQEEIDKQANQDNRDEKAAWKKKVKDAQRATGINAATSAANAGDQTVLRAIGTDGVSKDIENKAKELSNQIKTLRMLRDEIDKKGDQASAEDRDNLSKQISKVKELKTEVDGYLKIHEKYSGDNVTDLGDASSFGVVGTDQYWNNITEAIKKASTGKTTIKGLNADTGELTGTTRIAANTFATWSATVDPLTGRLSMLRTGIKKTETLVETITRKTKEIFTYFSGSSIIFKAFNELKKGVQYVRDIDLALTELKKVTDETEETYRRFLDTASKTAAKVGSTIKDVVSSTADWARLGYSMKEAAEFAESTQILMNVSEFTDVSQATDTLISAVQAFGYTAETSMDVVDLLNTIGNNYAISTADLAQSLTKSSASLVAAGGDLAEAAALTATANAIIQDADSVGTALKTTSLRLRGTSIKVLEEEGLDSDGAIESTSKLRSQVLATAGVDILTDSGAYKSTYQILLEIAEVWDRITDDKARAGLLELLAGKRNSSVIAALLQNPKKLEAAYKDAQNAEGSALKENEKYLDSIQGKIDQFNNTIQTLWSNTLDSDWVKRIVEAGTWLFKILDTLKPISVLIAGIAVYFNKKYNFVDFSNLFTGFKEAFSNSKGPKDFFKNLKNGFKDTEISIEKAKEKLNELEEQKTKLGDPKSEKNRREVDALDQEINAYKEMLASSEDLIAAQNKLNAAEKRLSDYKGDDTEVIQTYEREVKQAQLEVDNLTNAQQRAGKTGKTAFSGLGKSVKAFGKQVISVVSQMLIMLAITKLIELLSKAFDALITTPEEAAEKYEELNGELDTLKDNLKTIEGELSAIDDKMADLIAKGPLTFVEQEELDRLKAEREELERTLELNEQLAKQKQQQVNSQTSDQVEYYRNKGIKSGKTTAEKTGSGAATGTAIGAGAAGLALTATGGAAGLATALGVTGATQAWNPVGWGLLIAAGLVAAGAIIGTAIGAASGALEEKVDDSIENMEEKLAEKEAEVEKRRARYQKTGKDGDRKKYEEAQKALSDYRGEMAKYFTEIDAMYQNVDLSTIEDPDEYKRLKAEMNDFYNERDKWLIKSGAEGAESNAIERIFSKDDYKNASDTIDTLVEKLKKDPTDQSVLSQISEHCKVAEADLQAVGSSVDAARNYFTMLGQNAAFDTLGGKTAEITSATSKLQALLSNIKSADFTGLFGRGGEVNKIAIAEYFQGTSEATRTEIAKLVKSINDGKISVEDALKQFEYFGIDATIDIYLKENAVNLEEVTEKIDNIQDAYSALSDAVTQYNENGYLTLDNLQALLSLKPEYLALLQMENGQLSINQSAMETMVQAKLADAKATVIQSAMEQLHALASRTAADEVNNSATAASNAVSSLGEYASALGTVSKDAIVAAGAVTALNAAVAGAKANELVDQSEIDTIMSTMNNSLLMIDNLGANLSTNFKPIMGNDTDKDKDGKDDDEEDKIADGWEKLLAKYENKLALLSNERDLIQAEIDKAEAQGGKASAKYYEDLKRNSEDEKNLLTQKKAALEEYLAANAGAIDQDTWTDYNNEINATAVAIKECEINTIEWAEAIREIDLHYFEQITDEVSRLGEELDFVNSLLEDEEVADENGNWSSAALTRMGMYTQQMEKAATEAAMYQDKIDEVNEQYDKGVLSEEQYQEKLSDLVSGQQDAIQSYEDAKDSIVELNEARIDAIREGIDKEIEAFQDLTDAKKEELDAERD